MASKTLGRILCPICPHESAHVKVKTDKTTGTAFPYIHCAGCGCQLHTKNEEQANYLLAKTRPEKLDIPSNASMIVEGESVKIGYEVGQKKEDSAGFLSLWK